MKEERITVIGLGKMGSILCRSMLDKGIVSRNNLVGCDPRQENREDLKQELEIEVVADNKEGIKSAHTVILAVTPQVIDQVLFDIGDHLKREQTLISIVAGIPISYLEDKLIKPVPVIRVMPNMAASVKEAMTAVVCGHYATEKEKKRSIRIFSSIGHVVPLKEEMMDIVTGLSGSGPAYIYLIIEALSDGAVLMGMEREAARVFAAQTVLGAARMVLEGDLHPAQLREIVTSPGGTTISALKHLESDGVRGSMIRAVEAATRRSRELGQGQFS